jgi:GTP-binding protein Era
MEKKDWNIKDYIPTNDSVNQDYDNQKFHKAWDEVNEQIEKTLVIAFLGTVSSGKTSGIKTLFGIDLGNISPIPGATEEVKVVGISKNVHIVDAPGFGDIRVKVSQKAKDICEKIDIFVYILNADGGYKIQEKEDYQNLVSYNKEVLVVLNKIDLIRPHERSKFIEDQRNQMGVKAENFISAAFNPNPQISVEPINVDVVQDWIQDTLKRKGKDLLFAKVARQKDKICEKWIKMACGSAAIIGAIPIPGSDYGPLTALQVGIIAKIAHTYDCSISKKDTKEFIVLMFVAQAGKQVFKLILTSLKAAGWVGGPLAGVAVSALAATIAAGTTYGLGKAAQAYYKSGMQIPITEIQNIFLDSYNGYKKIKEGGGNNVLVECTKGCSFRRNKNNS